MNHLVEQGQADLQIGISVVEMRIDKDHSNLGIHAPKDAILFDPNLAPVSPRIFDDLGPAPRVAQFGVPACRHEPVAEIMIVEVYEQSLKGALVQCASISVPNESWFNFRMEKTDEERLFWRQKFLDLFKETTGRDATSRHELSVWLATEKGSLAVRELIAWVVLEKAQAVKIAPR